MVFLFLLVFVTWFCLIMWLWCFNSCLLSCLLEGCCLAGYVFMEEFVDRSVELDVLERAWRERLVFVVVCGRRRVGEMRLVREFLRSRRGVYFFSQLTSYEDNP